MNTAAPEPWAVRSGEVPCGWGSALAHGCSTEDADLKECVSHHRQRVEHCPPVRSVSFEPFQSKASSGPGSVSQLQGQGGGAASSSCHTQLHPLQSWGGGVPTTSFRGAPPLRKGSSHLKKNLPRDLHLPIPPHLRHLAHVPGWSQAAGST